MEGRALPKWFSIDTTTALGTRQSGNVPASRSVNGAIRAEGWGQVIYDNTGQDRWRYFVGLVEQGNPGEYLNALLVVNLKGDLSQASSWTYVNVSNPTQMDRLTGAVYHHASQTDLARRLHQHGDTRRRDLQT